MTNIAGLTQIVRQGSSITGVQVRERNGAISACEFAELAKLYVEDVNIMYGMPPDGAAGKTSKKESFMFVLITLKQITQKGNMILVRYLKQT